MRDAAGLLPEVRQPTPAGLVPARPERRLNVCAIAAGAVVLVLMVAREILRFANEARQSEPGRARPDKPKPDLPPTHTLH